MKFIVKASTHIETSDDMVELLNRYGTTDPREIAKQLKQDMVDSELGELHEFYPHFHESDIEVEAVN